MSRPQIAVNNGPVVVLELPPGWSSNLNIISCQSYIQIARVSCNEKTFRFISNGGTINQEMKDIKSGSKTVTMKGQENSTMLQLEFSYVNGRTLPSNKVEILNLSKPSGISNDTPDYVTFILLVEDVPSKNFQNARGGDVVATVHAINDSAPLSRQSPQAMFHAASQTLGDFHSITGSEIDKELLAPPPQTRFKGHTSNLPIGIVGAGAAGLYAAMILDSLGIKYEIIEGSKRAGGRLFTHKFDDPSGPYQYFDAGAMRYPDIPMMKRTFDLVRHKLNIGNKLIPVIMSNDNSILHFNGHRIKKGEYNANVGRGGIDAFGIGIAGDGKDGYIPDKYLRQGHKALYEQALEPLRQYFVDEPFPEAFKKLMQHDMHSVREYMSLKLGYPNAVIRWIETMEWRTGMFDASLTETVLASISFDDPLTHSKGVDDIEWYCFDGGSQVLVDAMLDAISIKPEYSQRVTAFHEVKQDDNETISVTIAGRGGFNFAANSSSSRKYSNVISTLPLSVLRTIDMDGVYLTSGQKSGLRELLYSPSIKVGIQFKTAWWEKMGIVGGQSHTDRPARSIVYPSHGPGLGNSKRSNVLIASYNGMQDSQRLGALMKGRNSPEEKILLDMIMTDLSVVHNIPVAKLWEEFIDYFPWDWYSHSFALGAFAWFGPGQFRDIYPHITMPASTKQRFFFAGDASSASHGWVAGALNSVWRCVRQMLIAHPEINPNPGEDIMKKFTELWGRSEEWPDDDLFAKHVYLGRNLADRRPNLP